MDRPAISVCVTHRPIDLSAAQAFLSDPAHGAMDLFIGTVRDNHQGKAVTGITYDVHVPLAEKILEEICARARTLWPGTRYYVAHFQGDLKVGEISILIGVGAAHRAEAFEACRFVIEEIKTRAPVWKREHYPDRDSAWMPGHALVGGARPCVAGVVLAGGRSARMGRCKALMPYRGQPLAVHMANILHRAGCAEVFVSGEVPGLACIPDRVAYRGPAVAMADLLRDFADRYEYLLFVPVDMPLIDPAALRFLIEGGHAAFFQSFPLPAVLRTAEYSVEETSSVRALLAAAGAREAPLSPAWEKTMVNLNTPQDWEALAS